MRDVLRIVADWSADSSFLNIKNGYLFVSWIIESWKVRFQCHRVDWTFLSVKSWAYFFSFFQKAFFADLQYSTFRIFLSDSQGEMTIIILANNQLCESAFDMPIDSEWFLQILVLIVKQIKLRFLSRNSSAEKKLLILERSDEGVLFERTGT